MCRQRCFAYLGGAFSSIADQRLARRDTRVMAAEWIEEHVLHRAVRSERLRFCSPAPYRSATAGHARISARGGPGGAASRAARALCDRRPASRMRDRRISRGGRAGAWVVLTDIRYRCRMVRRARTGRAGGASGSCRVGIALRRTL